MFRFSCALKRCAPLEESVQVQSKNMPLDGDDLVSKGMTKHVAHLPSLYGEKCRIIRTKNTSRPQIKQTSLRLSLL